MSVEVWIVIIGFASAILATSLWSARRYETQIKAAEGIQRRSLELIDRQEVLIRRAESLLDRLERRVDS